MRAAMHSPRPLFALVVTCAACSAQPATSHGPAGSADAAPLASAAPTPSAPAPAASPAPAPAASSAPAASAVPTAEPSAAPTASAAAEAPLPAVKISNIGMHIGGGPNDDVTKDPIRRSVHPHFDAFRRCFGLAEDPKKGGTFGVDLLVDKAGGKAQVSRVATTLKGKDFKECVVKVFEGIDFLKPKGGTTKVSYSLRFTPGK